MDGGCRKGGLGVGGVVEGIDVLDPQVAVGGVHTNARVDRNRDNNDNDKPKVVLKGRATQDSNLRPLASEASALSN